MQWKLVYRVDISKYIKGNRDTVVVIVILINLFVFCFVFSLNDRVKKKALSSFEKDTLMSNLCTQLDYKVSQLL